MDDLIKDEVQRLCSRLGVEYGDIRGNCRRHDLVMSRVIIAEYLRSVLLLSTRDIGMILNKNRSLVSYYNKVYIKEYEYSPLFRKMADIVMKQYGYF